MTDHEFEPDDTIALSPSEGGPERSSTACGEDGDGADLTHHHGFATTLPLPSDGDTTVFFPGGRPRAGGGAAPIAPVAGYEILEELGRGGMGVVYKARQIGLNRLVALKMILAGAHASREAIARFRTEAEAVASLQHPNIVQIYEIGEQDGKPYFSLEFVEGGSLADLLNGTPMPAAQAARLAEVVARTVHAAHLRGIVHRDLKPVNVLMTPDGEPKIADFGLAKRIDAAEGQTESGSILGSPSYMAPEQAEGKTRDIGPATDVYALGAILYEMLTGRPPFRAETAMRTMKQVVEVEPVPPGRLLPELARDVETICLKCLQKEPSKRYESAEALAEDLHRFRHDEPIVARPIGLIERGVRWRRRNRLMANLMAALLLLMGVSLVGATATAVLLGLARQRVGQAYYRAVTEAQRATEQARIAREATSRADNKARDLEQQLCFNRILLAQSQIEANQVARADALLDACPPALREWEWHYLRHLGHADLMTWTSPAAQASEAARADGAVPAVAISPAGDLIASSSGDGSISLRDARTGREARTLSGHAWTVTSLAFSRDGDRLVSGSLDQTVRVWNVSSGELIQTFQGHQTPVRAVAVRPGGDLIASAGGDDQRGLGELRLWDVNSGRVHRALRGHEGVVTSVRFTPDGRRLASGGADGSVRVWDADEGKSLAVLRGHVGPVQAVAFLADGRTLASAGDDRSVRLWDTFENHLADELTGHSGPVLALSASARGARLASAGADGTVRVWSPSPAAAGSAPRVYRGHAGPVLGVSLAADGRLLASSDAAGAVKLWNPNEPPDAFLLGPRRVELRGLAFSRDGRLIAAAGADGVVRVWEAATHAKRLTLRGHTEPVLAVAFSPDDRLIASAGVDAEVRLWDARSGESVAVLTGHRNDVRDLAFTADSRTLASASTDATIRLWTIDPVRRTASFLRELTGHTQEVTSVAFRAGSHVLASGSRDGTVRLWDVDARRLIRTLRQDDQLVLDVAFSPDGRRLASAGSDREIVIWDAATGRRVGLLDDHTGPVSALAFDASGKRLFSAGWDQTVRVWDVAASQEILTLRGHTGEIFALTVSTHAARLATAGADGALRLWESGPRSVTGP